MSESNDAPPAAVGLEQIPTLADIVLQIERSSWQQLQPMLARLPLMNLLNEILTLSARSEEPQARALLDLARLAVAKHEYPRRLYGQLLDAVTKDGSKEIEVLPNLAEADARLAMEMLSLMADLLAANNLHENGVRTFEIAELISERFKLIANKGVVYQQLGMYQLKRGEFAKAEAALKKAADIFSQVAPEVERQTNYQRAIVYKLRLGTEDNPPEPDGMEQILACDPNARDLILLARAGKAIDRDDLATAQALLGQLAKDRAENVLVSGEALLTQARLARRQGDFEKAELLLKRAAKTSRAAGPNEVAWQQYYLARDLGHTEESQALLEQLKDESGAVRVEYQKALVAHNSGDDRMAEKLLRSCLSKAENELARADCLGTLALITEDGLEGRRLLHEAIGLYVKHDRKLDHAISLSHLAIIEIGDGLLKKQSGWPREALSEFRRADDLLQSAQQIAESLGALSFLLDLIVNRARLEMVRERYHEALDYFKQAATSLELTYLAMTDRKSAHRYLVSYTSFYEIAIDCALLAGETDTALLFSERSKARRFLRDAAETTYDRSAGSGHALFARERQLLATIQPLRSRLLQQRSLSLDERQALYDAEQQLRRLWREMRQTPEVWSELSKRVHQPVEVSVLRRFVFSSLPVTSRAADPNNMEVMTK